MPNESTLERLAKLLEEAGYENAMDLIIKNIIPLAKEHSISIYRALITYHGEAVNADQNTSYYQLHVALTRVTMGEIEALDIHTPL